MEALDFTGAEETSFDPIPKGTYVVNLVKGETTQTKGTGKWGVRPMMKMQFKVSDEDANGDEQPYKGRYVFDQIVVPPKEVDGQPNPNYKRGMGNIMTFYKAVGMDEAAIKKLKKAVDWDDITGKQLRIQVKIQSDETYGDSNRVVTYKPLASETEASDGGLGDLL